MGNYTKNLFKGRKRNKAHAAPAKGERLVSVAIIRDGKVYHGERSHYNQRFVMGDPHPTEPMPGDRNGFRTSKQRFVNRAEGHMIAVKAGQCQPMSREMLSSDVNW